MHPHLQNFELSSHFLQIFPNLAPTTVNFELIPPNLADILVILVDMVVMLWGCTVDDDVLVVMDGSDVILSWGRVLEAPGRDVVS